MVVNLSGMELLIALVLFAIAFIALAGFWSFLNTVLSKKRVKDYEMIEHEDGGTKPKINKTRNSYTFK